MANQKLQCDKCGRTWHGPEDKIGSRHTECKQKGTWQIEGSTTVRELAHPVPQKPKPTKQRLPSQPDGVDRFATEVRKQNQYVVNWHFLVWNRLGLKGWAVAGVQGYRDVFVEMVPDYSSRLYSVLEPRLAHEIQEGVTFVTDPIGVIELVLRQLSRHESENVPEGLAEHLLQAQKLLALMKDGFTPPLEWTHHNEVKDDSPSFFTPATLEVE